MKIVNAFFNNMDETAEIETFRAHIYIDDSHFVIKAQDGELLISAFNGRIAISPEAANLIRVKEY